MTGATVTDMSAPEPADDQEGSDGEAEEVPAPDVLSGYEPL